MKLWQKAVYQIRRALTLTNPEGWTPSASTSHAGETVTSTSVLGLSTAWACVNLLAGTIASMPVEVTRRGPHGVDVPTPDHPLADLLDFSPNADQTSVDFWEFICLSIELWGNGYAEVTRAGNGRVIALTPVRPDIVTVDRAPNGDLRYTWTDEGRRVVRMQSEMLHIRGFGGSPLGGLSTLAYGRNTFGLAAAIDKAAGTTFANGLRPSGTLTFDKFLTDDQRKIAEERLAAKFVGAMNAGRPMVLEGGTKWEQLTINPEDAQMLQSRAFSVEEVCRVFSVPPFMVGHTEKSTSWGTGIEQQTLGFQKFTLRKRLKKIEKAVCKQLLTPADRAAGIKIKFNIESLLRGDSAARAAFYTALLNAGVMTINEVRALEGLPPVEGGDVPRMQIQNVPITQAGLPAPDASIPGASA